MVPVEVGVADDVPGVIVAVVAVVSPVVSLIVPLVLLTVAATVSVFSEPVSAASREHEARNSARMTSVVRFINRGQSTKSARYSSRPMSAYLLIR